MLEKGNPGKAAQEEQGCLQKYSFNLVTKFIPRLSVLIRAAKVDD